LKQIASHRNPAVDQAGGGQSAASLARQVLEELGLFYDSDAQGN